MQNNAREQISDVARELMNEISVRTCESYTGYAICQIEVRTDDHMSLQMDQAYWTVAGQTRRAFNLQGLYGS